MNIPNTPDKVEAAKIDSLATSNISGSLNANKAINKLIVKPMPHKNAIPINACYPFQQDKHID